MLFVGLQHPYTHGTKLRELTPVLQVQYKGPAVPELHTALVTRRSLNRGRRAADAHPGAIIELSAQTPPEDVLKSPLSVRSAIGSVACPDFASLLMPDVWGGAVPLALLGPLLMAMLSQFLRAHLSSEWREQ